MLQSVVLRRVRSNLFRDVRGLMRMPAEKVGGLVGALTTSATALHSQEAPPGDGAATTPTSAPDNEEGALVYLLSGPKGPERVHLVGMLQKHGVVVQGGTEEAKQLIDSLIDWKHGEGTSTSILDSYSDQLRKKAASALADKETAGGD